MYKHIYIYDVIYVKRERYTYMYICLHSSNFVVDPNPLLTHAVAGRRRGRGLGVWHRHKTYIYIYVFTCIYTCIYVYIYTFITK